MFKGVTLLQRYCAATMDEQGPDWMHAPDELSRRLPGLFRYNQNHVEDRCWQFGADKTDLEALGEFWFETNSKLMPLDRVSIARTMSNEEQRLLFDLTALMVDNAWATYSDARYKFILIGNATDPSRTIQDMILALQECAQEFAPAEFRCEYLRSRYARVLPPSDSVPPNLLVTIWSRTRAIADKLILTRRSILRSFVDAQATSAAVYHVNEKQIL